MPCPAQQRSLGCGADDIAPGGDPDDAVRVTLELPAVLADELPDEQIWNALKFVVMGPISFVLLLRARSREHAARRLGRRGERALMRGRPG